MLKRQSGRQSSRKGASVGQGASSRGSSSVGSGACTAQSKGGAGSDESFAVSEAEEATTSAEQPLPDGSVPAKYLKLLNIGLHRDQVSQ